MDTNKTATLKDVARAAGLSVTAVSHALNGKRGVSPATAERVRKIADEMHYRPNIIAKSLRTNRTKTLGVVASDSSHSFYAVVVKGVDDIAYRNDYSILLCNTEGNREREWEAVRLLVNKRVDGILLISSTLTSTEDMEMLAGTDVPVMFLIRSNEHANARFVVNDNVQGAFLMTDHLLRSTKRVHFLNMPQNVITAHQRLQGYRNAHEKHGIPFDPSLVHYVKAQIQEGYIAMRQLLDHEKVEAVFCGCDVIAVGAMDAIIERGLDIPGDIRIGGYDDIDFAPYLRVPLTTVRQPKFILGSKACECLLETIEHPETAPQHIVLRPELIIRQST